MNTENLKCHERKTHSVKENHVSGISRNFNRSSCILKKCSVILQSVSQKCRHCEDSFDSAVELKQHRSVAHPVNTYRSKNSPSQVELIVSNKL